MWNACIGALILLQAIELQPRIERLDNSLRVIIVEDHTLPLLSVQLWYAVGSAYDDPKNPGLCHITRTILEHRDDAALRLRAAGVRFESRTLPDACYFASLCPPNFLEFVLTIEAARMQPLKTTPELIAVGLAAAARDYGLNPDDPAKLNERRLLAAMFPDHPYRHPAAFVADSLKTLAPDDVDEFLQRWFVPGNATLLIIGDVSDVAALDLVRQHFGKLPWAEPPHRPSWPAPAAEQIELRPVAAEHLGLDFAWLTPGASFGESASTAVLMQRLCNPIDGPLSRRLADLGCPPPRWHHDEWREQGMLVLSVDTDPAPSGDVGRPDEDTNDAAPPRNETPASAPTSQLIDTARIERIIRDELERAARDIPTEVELNRARALAARELRLRRASFRQRALDLGWNELVAGDVLLADFARARTERLAVPDVQQAAADLLAASTVTTPRIMHSPTTTQPTTSQRAPSPVSLTAKPAIALDSNAALKLLAAHSEAAPSVDGAGSPAALTVREVQTGISLTVCAVAGLEPAVVRTRVAGPINLSCAPSALMAVASTRHSVDEVRDYLSYRGLDLFPSRLRDRPGLTSRGPAREAAQMIELQAELIRCAYRLPDRCTHAAELHQYADNLFDIQTALDDSGELYLPRHLIGWRPGGYLERTDIEVSNSLRCLDHLTLIEILVVGDVREDAVLEVVGAAWSGWKPAKGTPPTSSCVEPVAPATQGRPYVEIHTMAGWTVSRKWPSRLMVLEGLDVPATALNERDIAVRCARRLLARSADSSPALDAQREWRWAELPGSDAAGLNFVVWPAPADIELVITEYLAHCAAIQSGTLPPEVYALAERLARCEQLLVLDDSDRIADLLESSPRNPWELPPQRSPGDVAQLTSRCYQVALRLIGGVGPEDHAAELRQFNYAPSTTSAPSSP